MTDKRDTPERRMTQCGDCNGAGRPDCECGEVPAPPPPVAEQPTHQDLTDQLDASRRVTPAPPHERCWFCKTVHPESALRIAAGVGWSCIDTVACLARRTRGTCERCGRRSGELIKHPERKLCVACRAGLAPGESDPERCAEQVLAEHAATPPSAPPADAGVGRPGLPDLRTRFVAQAESFYGFKRTQLNTVCVPEVFASGAEYGYTAGHAAGRAEGAREVEALRERVRELETARDNLAAEGGAWDEAYTVMCGRVEYAEMDRDQARAELARVREAAKALLCLLDKHLPPASRGTRFADWRDELDERRAALSSTTQKPGDDR